jgi:2-polyprenyl-6-methoxyphenol hydroxylase-like FAD-dependent oxidoreductase
MSNPDNIIVVGAGLAGTTAAAVLGQQGYRVTLVDPRPCCPPVFKAEKIEPDQVRLLRKLGLLERLLPRAGRIREVRAYYNGRLFGTSQTEQYGTYYSDMVNALRANLSATVDFKLERVVHIANHADLQRVKLASGEELISRLVVLACGLNADIPLSLGLKRSYVQKRQSAALAFTISRSDAQPFPFDSITYYTVSPELGIDYLTLFPIGQAVRANLFAFPSDDSWIREFVLDPDKGLQRCIPKLHRAIGEYRVTSKAETAVVHLYRTAGEPPPGVVLIGDAAQNVCPSTGMGLTKILTDVDVLCSECMPLWFKSDGMGVDKLSSFFDNPRKRAVDLKALRNAYYRRQASTGRSLKWKIHRTRLHLGMQFKRPW